MHTKPLGVGGAETKGRAGGSAEGGSGRAPLAEGMTEGPESTAQT